MVDNEETLMLSIINHVFSMNKTVIFLKLTELQNAEGSLGLIIPRLILKMAFGLAISE
jgi:hypothetical protein